MSRHRLRRGDDGELFVERSFDIRTPSMEKMIRAAKKARAIRIAKKRGGIFYPLWRRMIG